MTETVSILVGTLEASHEDRIATALLLPYGEEAVSNIGRVTIDPGTIEIPADLLGMGLNFDHQREQVAGALERVTDTPQGLVAQFRYANTPAGDAALAEARDPNGKRRSVSAEVADLVIRAGRSISGRLFGAAQTERGAFPSATLLATAVDTPNPTTTTEGVTMTTTAPAAPAAPEAPAAPDLATLLAQAQPPAAPAPAPAAPVLPAHPLAAHAPSTLLAQQPIGQPAAEKVGLALFTDLLSAAHTTGDTGLFAALKDVKVSGANTLGAASAQPEYLGELWQGRRFARKIIPLLSSGALRALTAKGWRWVIPPEVDEWAGNKTDIHSVAPTAEQVDFAMQRFAGGNDIAREFIDFGMTEEIASYLRGLADSYARKTDAWALAQIRAGATVVAPGEIVPDTNSGMVKLIRGALAVINADASPSFAIMNMPEYEQFLYTKKNDVLAYLEMALGLEEGKLASFKIVPDARLDAGEVIVGDRQAAYFDELPGSPIRVSAIDLLKGGVDEALFGYVRYRNEYPAGIVKITGELTEPEPEEPEDPGQQG